MRTGGPEGVLMKRAALAFSLALFLTGIADAQTPRKGGTIRMTAPYGTNISTMDMHATPRAQDDIYGKVVHRTLYNYDSEKGVPVLYHPFKLDQLADHIAAML